MKRIKAISIIFIFLWLIVLILGSYFFTTRVILVGEKNEERHHRQAITEMSSKLINSEDINFLIKNLPEKPNFKYSSEIFSTIQYSETLKILKIIKNSFPKEVSDIYIIVQEGTNVKLVVDDCKGDFGSSIDAKNWPVMLKALDTKSNQSEIEFYWDDGLKEWSTSTYYVINDENGEYLALIGVDFFRKDWNQFEMKYIFYSFWICLSFVILGFFIPLISLGLVKIKIFPKIEI